MLDSEADESEYWHKKKRHVQGAWYDSDESLIMEENLRIIKAKMGTFHG